MLRTVTATLTTFALLATSAMAQLFVGAGSTVQGDYLRGFGISAIGMGEYNLFTARADQIETQTAITLDSYLRMVISNDNREKAQSRARRLAHRISMYSQIRDRVLNNPAPSDLRIGDAHNALLVYLSAGSDSGMKLNPIVLPTDIVRCLPFKLNKEGASFSLTRLRHKGRVPWPVAFQDQKFAVWKVAYDKAMGDALDARLDGNLSKKKIDAVAKAIDDLEAELNFRVSSKPDAYFNEANTHIRELKKAFEGLKSRNIQRALIDLDGYMGTTVYELRNLMLNHDLKFAEPETPEEIQSYRVLYDALVAQRNISEPGTREAK